MGAPILIILQRALLSCNVLTLTAPWLVVSPPSSLSCYVAGRPAPLSAPLIITTAVIRWHPSHFAGGTTGCPSGQVSDGLPGIGRCTQQADE